MDDTANLIEHVRYSSSGVPIGFVGGDVESDGDMDVSDTADSDQFDTWILASAYDARADMNRDGIVDAADKTLALNNAGIAYGRGVLSGDPDTATGNRKGYAGYELATSLAGSAGIYDARNRFLIASLGRWSHRDKLGYIDGMNLYEYSRSNPIAGLDPSGFAVLTIISNDDNPFGGPCYGKCKWKFRATGMAKGCTPIVIQKVTNTGNCTECQSGLSVSDTGVYWEIIPVEDSSGSGIYTSGWDFAEYEAPPNSCGDFRQVGEAYLFCLEAIVEEHRSNPFLDWNQVSVEICERDVTSGSWGGTLDNPPSWFNNLVPLDEKGRQLLMDWPCGCNPTEVSCTHSKWPGQPNLVGSL